MADLLSLQQTLGVSLKDSSLLEQALVHSSYINENPSYPSASNERLEFLGDAVLGLVTAQKLYQDSPHLTEGEMTRLRAALVRQETLSRVAKMIGLGEYLYLGKGEEASGGRTKPLNLANALEAVIAAIYLDQGLTIVKDVILRLLAKELRQVTNLETGIDYKSQLQELIQAKLQQTPTYHILESDGPAHDRTFSVEVRIGLTILGRGLGKSKKIAESEAARTALGKLLEK